MKFLVETSARHAHVSQEDLEILFGEGSQLTIKKELSQPGQYASEQKITVIGPRGQLAVTILGPTRKSTQVELSMTDARQIGLSAPVRESGDTAGSAGCKLVGPEGEVMLKEGIIIAKRHIHMTPEQARQLGVEDKQVVSVKIDTNGRSVIFGDTIVRAHSTYALAMHIDTDEANAAGASGEVFGEIIK